MDAHAQVDTLLYSACVINLGGVSAPYYICHWNLRLILTITTTEVVQTQGFLFDCLLLFYAATLFQLYHGVDMNLWDEKNKAQAYNFTDSNGTFNLPHHIGMVWEELAFDDRVSYTQ